MSYKRQTTARSEPKAPDMRAYSVKDGKGDQPGFWTPLGAAFRHEDGKGFTVLLDALPLTGRIVLRVPDQERA